MIRIRAKKEQYLYNAYHIVKAFYPSQEAEQEKEEGLEQDLELVFEDGVRQSFQAEQYGDKADRRSLDRALYRYLAERTGREQSWGILTGIRPSKLAMQALEQGVCRQEFVQDFRKDYLVTEEKAGLAYDIARRERELLAGLDCKTGYSLYVGVPFCPSVCSYCSFSSGSAEHWRAWIPAYVDALCKELEYIGRVSAGHRLNTIYIGGGTPTSLEAEELEKVLSCIDRVFSREHLLEYTVEAGRPDSITEEKLKIIRSHGVSRISINPQTMQQKTLERVGRRHSVQEVVEAYEMARRLGFDNINMDLIAGLPGEGPDEMADTLRQISSLQPDSLTVHALAIKRAAQMGQEKSAASYGNLRQQEHTLGEMAENLSEMIACARAFAEQMGLVPYYLYRQKNMAGSFENVGYAKVDKAGIYNILIMEEKQSIVAAGAGASTKLLLPEPVPVPGSRNGRMTTLMRIENVKSVRDYVTRIDEMIERKGEWLWR